MVQVAVEMDQLLRAQVVQDPQEQEQSILAAAEEVVVHQVVVVRVVQV